MSTQTAPVHVGLGDRLRLWWDALSRPAQWGFGVPFFVLLAMLPVLRQPVLTTEGTDFGGVMAQFGMYALLAIGLNVVVGQAGLLEQVAHVRGFIAHPGMGDGGARADRCRRQFGPDQAGRGRARGRRARQGGGIGGHRTRGSGQGSRLV